MIAWLPYISMAAAAVLSLAALVARHPTTIICTLILGAFFTFPVYVFAQGYNSALFVTDVVLAFALLRYVAGWQQGPHAQRPPWLGLSLAMIAMVIVSRLIVLARFPDAKSILQLFFYTFRMSTMMALFILPACIRYTRRQVAAILICAVLGCGLVGLLGVLQYAKVLDLSYSAAWVVVGRESENTSEDADLHVFLLGYNRKTLGLLMQLGALTSTGLMVVTRSRLIQALALGSLFFCLATLLGSHSRSSLVGLIGGVAVTLIYLRLGQAAILAVLLGIAGVVVISIWGEEYGLVERYKVAIGSQNIATTTSTRSRMDAWMDVTKYLLSNPIDLMVGGGFLHFSAYYNKYLQVTVLAFAHNLYIHTVAELGLLGAPIFFGWYLRSAWHLIWLRGLLPPAEKLRIYFGCSLGGLAGGFAAGIADDTLYPHAIVWPYLQVLLVLLGTAVGFARQWMEPGAFDHVRMRRTP